ncbi:hypothetical protein [Micromonospora radicis]|uniref:hypothetical protein n=1 Tax=Micromonospora radicis TaxID=1894971 RepID=UPI001313DD4C|nr:hypothetical protein [Micromonospora radicis]
MTEPTARLSVGTAAGDYDRFGRTVHRPCCAGRTTGSTPAAHPEIARVLRPGG